MIAVELVPLAKLIEQVRPSTDIPSGASDLVVPKGIGWIWLTLWLVAEAHSLPTELVPDVAKVFRAWLLARYKDWTEVNVKIVTQLFDWLILIEAAMRPRFDDRAVKFQGLRVPHLRDARDEIRMPALSFAHLSPPAAERYLRSLEANATRHDEMPDHFRLCEHLGAGAPNALTDYALNALIEKEDRTNFGRRRYEFGPFSAIDHHFLTASPGQGPFFELLEHAPPEGLRLVRAIVEHATTCVRDRYSEERQPFPCVTIRFPDAAKTFHGGPAIYFWARDRGPSALPTSALMALEAWAHREIERGRSFEEVLRDVMGPDGSSIAFVAVAIDVALSHWRAARDVAWPFVASPEILQLDDARLRAISAGFTDCPISPRTEQLARQVRRSRGEAFSS